MAVRKATTTDDLTREAPEAPEGYTVLTGLDGKVVTVPDTIVEGLLDSGFKRK